MVYFFKGNNFRLIKIKLYLKKEQSEEIKIFYFVFDDLIKNEFIELVIDNDQNIQIWFA